MGDISKILVGVRFYNNRWSSRVKVNGKDIHLGSFNTQEEAYNAREEYLKNPYEYNPHFHANHKMSKTRLYRIWRNMKTRCTALPISDKNYKHYEGRGINICKEWVEFMPFMDWALKNGYDNKLTLDRKDNDKGYCPENCRWTTISVQNINTQRFKEAGIYFFRNKWHARATFNKKTKYLGSHNSIEKAKYARIEYFESCGIM
jgi:hypothetical protein